MWRPERRCSCQELRVSKTKWAKGLHDRIRAGLLARTKTFPPGRSVQIHLKKAEYAWFVPCRRDLLHPSNSIQRTQLAFLTISARCGLPCGCLCLQWRLRLAPGSKPEMSALRMAVCKLSSKCSTLSARAALLIFARTTVSTAQRKSDCSKFQTPTYLPPTV